MRWQNEVSSASAASAWGKYFQDLSSLSLCQRWDLQIFLWIFEFLSALGSYLLSRLPVPTLGTSCAWSVPSFCVLLGLGPDPTTLCCCTLTTAFPAQSGWAPSDMESPLGCWSRWGALHHSRQESVALSRLPALVACPGP